MTADIHALPARLADCLKLCYLLRERGERITAQAVRTLLAAREPTGRLSGSVVTHTFAHLHALGYVSHTRYHGVELTEAGEAAAAELVRHHRLLELFLFRILHIPLDQVDAEAEQLEHVLSELVEDQIDALLGHPTIDPHGDPIPDMLGHVHVAPSVRLSDVPAGQQVCVQRLTTRDPDLIRYLELLGLVPGAVLHLESRTPYGEVLTVLVGDTPRLIGTVIADQVQVSIIQEPPQEQLPSPDN